MKFLILLIFLSHNLMADEYWRPPIIGLSELMSNDEYFDRHSAFLGADNPSVVVYLTALGKQGYELTNNKNLYFNYLTTL